MKRMFRLAATLVTSTAMLVSTALLMAPEAKAARGSQTGSVATIYLDTRGGYYDARPEVPVPTASDPATALAKVNGDYNHNTAAFVNIEVSDPLNPSNNFIDNGTTNATTGATTYGELKGRGNYTWKTIPMLGTPPVSDWVWSQGLTSFSSSNVTKRPYQIKLSSSRDVLGMGVGKTWILLANHADASLMRNKVAFDLAAQFGLAYSSEARFVDVVLNGSYRGSYLMTEKVQEGGSRVKFKNLADREPNAKYKTGVLVELDNNNCAEEPPSLRWNSPKSGTCFVLKDASAGVPNVLKGGDLETPIPADTALGWQYFQDRITTFENLLYSSSPDWGQISAIIDQDSFIKFYFVNELAANPEIAKSSIYFYTAVDAKVYAGPVWDFDSSMGSYSTIELGSDPNRLYVRNIKSYRSGNDWFQQLFRMPAFDTAARTLYATQLKERVDGVISTTYLYQNLMAESAAKNFAKWQILGGRVLYPPFWDSYKSTWLGEVNDLRNWLGARIAFLNNYYAPNAPAFPSDCKTEAATAAITTPGAFNALNPCRILDTRYGNGSNGAVAPMGVVKLKVTGRGGIPDAGAAAVVLNVTVANPTAAGFIAAYPSDVATAPVVSNINYVAGQVVPNQVTVKVGPDGVVNLKSDSSGTTHLIADLAGYFTAGQGTEAGSFNALSPARILDTREAVGVPSAAPIAGGGDITVTVAGAAGAPTQNVSAVALNVTAVNPASNGHLTVYPADLPNPPLASNLNFVTGQAPTANAVIVKLSPDGKVKIHNGGPGAVGAIADISGYYVGGTASNPGMFVPVAPARILDSRVGTGMVATDAFKDAGTARWTSNFETLKVKAGGVGGIPASAASSVVMNVTVAGATQQGYITIFPDGTLRPNASSLNYSKGQTIPNLVTVKLGTKDMINMYFGSAGQTAILADVAGYYRK